MREFKKTNFLAVFRSVIGARCLLAARGVDIIFPVMPESVAINSKPYWFSISDECNLASHL